MVFSDVLEWAKMGLNFNSIPFILSGYPHTTSKSVNISWENRHVFECTTNEFSINSHKERTNLTDYSSMRLLSNRNMSIQVTQLCFQIIDDYISFVDAVSRTSLEPEKAL